jgi:cysteine desulfurase
MNREQQITHYFDWAATSPADSDILQIALEESSHFFGNPSSIHQAGQAARSALEKARERCADILAVNKSQLFFTSGGTESDHIPLLSLLSRPGKGTILISEIEHPAIREQAIQLKQLGYTIQTIPPDTNGFIQPDTVLKLLTSDTLYIAVMTVNNETGCIQDIHSIAGALTTACAGKRKPRFHTDCVQAAGKIPLTISYPGIDSAAFSAHKICGPRGIGLLYTANQLTPFLKGGGQEQTIRSGTENLFGAIALSHCLERYWISDNNVNTLGRFHKQQEWTQQFVSRLDKIPNCTLVPKMRTDESTASQFSPWIVQASFARIPGEVMVRALDAKGFYISTGSACSAKKHSRPILAAMKISTETQESAVRFSFGPGTTEHAMKELADAVYEICKTFGNT